MRAIKFRFWNKAKKKMLYGYNDLLWEALINPTEADIVMQWTGLKDKKNIGIYEGDIITLYGTDIKGEIIWYYLSWQVKDSGMLANMNKLGLEVIGNIYSNPELLK